MPTVLIGRDAQVDTLLDTLANDLASLGVDVLRGPPAASGHALVYDADRDGLLFAQADVAVFPSRHILPRALMTRAPRLHGIVSPTIGLDGVDLPAAKALGIIVGHGAVPENIVSMAEATVMLILMLRYQPLRSRAVLQGTLPRPASTANARWARMAQGCTIGLAGFGRIGQAVAERLRGFGCTLLVADHPSLDRAAASRLDAKVLPWPAVLAHSDILSLHANVSPGDGTLLDAQALALMKPGACLVNTARGQLVDEAALHAALREGRLAGAALDTFAIEPLPADSPLRQLDNVFLTPHLVGQTRDMYAALQTACLENVTRILAGKLPLHCKNPEAEPAWRARLAARPPAGA